MIEDERHTHRRLLRLQATRHRRGPAIRCAHVVVLSLLAIGLCTGVALASGGPDDDWYGSEPANVSHSPTTKALQPAVATGPSRSVMVAWSDERTAGERDIVATLSSDGGWSWSAPQVVSVTGSVSLLPDALFAGGDAWLAWSDQAIGWSHTMCTANLDPQSGTWTSQVVPGSGSGDPNRPSLAASQGRLHLAFHAGPLGRPNILYAGRWLTDTAWPTAGVVVTSTPGTGSKYPSLAISPDGAAAHLVWEEHRIATVTRTIKYMEGTLVGEEVAWTWPPTELWTGRMAGSEPAFVAVDSQQNVHVAWGELVDTGGESERYVRYTRRDSASGSWLPSVRVDDEPWYVNSENPYGAAPRLALHEVGDRVRLCVVWHGFRQSDIAEEVLLSCSTDGGTSWSPPENVSRTPGSNAMSIRPAVALAASGQLHVAWQERLGPDPQWDYQVHYARSAAEMALPFVTRVWRYLPHKAFAPFVLRGWEASTGGVLLRPVMRSD